MTLHCELHVHFVPLPPGPRRRQAGRGARVFSRRVVTACPQVAGPAHPPFTRRLLSRACSGPGSGKGEQGGHGCTGGSCQLGVPVSGRRSFGFPSRAVFAPSPCLLPLTACDKAVCEWGRVGMTTSFDSLFVPRPPLSVDAPAPLKSASPSSLRAGDNDVLFVVFGFRASGARAVPVVPCGPLLCTCPWFSISPPSTPVPLASARFARG